MSRLKEYLYVKDHILKVSKGNPNIVNQAALELLELRINRERIINLLEDEKQIFLNSIKIKTMSLSVEGLLDYVSQLECEIIEFKSQVRNFKAKDDFFKKSNLIKHKIFKSIKKK